MKPEKTSTDGIRIITINNKATAISIFRDIRGFIEVGGGGGGGKSMLNLMFLVKFILNI